MNDKKLSSGKVRLSNYTLDTFIAPKLSQLTECNAPDLSNLTDQWLNNFILNSIFRVKVNEPKKAHLFNFLRRLEAAFNEYNNAYIALNEYVSTQHNNISPYFRSLLHFETFFAQLHQAILFIELGAELKKRELEELFKEDVGLILKKVRKIYNASKHMDERIENGKEKGKLPENFTTTVWISNDGIECIDKKGDEIKVTFIELKYLLTEISILANRISNPDLIRSK